MSLSLTYFKPLLQKQISAGKTACIWTGLDSAGTAALLCLMGAPGPPGSVGQMGCQVPGPISVLNGLSSVRLPSWFCSHVTQSSARSTLPDYPFQELCGGRVLGGGGGVHIRCASNSVLACKTSHGTISVRSKHAETCSFDSARPHSYPSICFKRFHIGEIFRSFSRHPGQQRADSLIDRTQTLTGLCKME